LEAILAAATALLHLMRSWPSMNQERPDLMVRAASCIINLVASLDSPDASLKACREFTSSSSSNGPTTMTSHVLFLTIHALTMEMCALLPLNTQFLSESFPRFAASFPSLLASTSRLLVLGTYGETTLLATNCLLNSDDASIQLGSAQWQSSSNLGTISHEESMGGESIEKESLMHGIASAWGSSMIGYGSSKLGNTRGVLSETEQEIAVIECILWTAPIIADACGKGGGGGGKNKRGGAGEAGAADEEQAGDTVADTTVTADTTPSVEPPAAVADRKSVV
jgi:hypothetical protein